MLIFLASFKITKRDCKSNVQNVYEELIKEREEVWDAHNVLFTQLGRNNSRELQLRFYFTFTACEIEYIGDSFWLQLCGEILRNEIMNRRTIKGCRKERHNSKIAVWMYKVCVLEVCLYFLLRTLEYVPWTEEETVTCPCKTEGKTMPLKVECTNVDVRFPNLELLKTKATCAR